MIARSGSVHQYAYFKSPYFILIISILNHHMVTSRHWFDRMRTVLEINGRTQHWYEVMKPCLSTSWDSFHCSPFCLQGYTVCFTLFSDFEYLDFFKARSSFRSYAENLIYLLFRSENDRPTVVGSVALL